MDRSSEVLDGGCERVSSKKPLRRCRGGVACITVLLFFLFLLKVQHVSASVAKTGAAAYAQDEAEDEEPPPVVPAPSPVPSTGHETGGGAAKAERGTVAADAAGAKDTVSRQRVEIVSSSALEVDLENLERYTDVNSNSDEFDGLELLKQLKKDAAYADKQSRQQQQQSQQQQQQHMAAHTLERKQLEEYWPEALGLLLVLAYAFNYIAGSSKNRAIAEAWLDACRGKLEDNFAIVGVANKGTLLRESAVEYCLYCSGRVNCRSVSITLHLAPRHDLFLYLYSILQAEAMEDTWTIEVELGGEAETGGRMDKFVFGVTHKASEAELRKSERSLESPIVVRRWKTNLLHETFVCLSDDEEIAKELLPSVVLDALNHHTQYLKSLNISHSQLFGQPFNPHHRRTAPGLRFTFALLPGDRHTTKHGAGEKSMHDKLVVAELLLVVAMKLVDKATEHKLSAACRDRLAKLHANHQLAVQQQLAQQQRKREKAAGSDKRRKDK